jgi:hypothetical protein
LPSDPFLWQSDKMTDIGTPSGDFGFASYIDQRGDTVSAYVTYDRNFHRILRRTQQMIDLDVVHLDTDVDLLGRSTHLRDAPLGPFRKTGPGSAPRVCAQDVRRAARPNVATIRSCLQGRNSVDRQSEPAAGVRGRHALGRADSRAGRDHDAPLASLSCCGGPPEGISAAWWRTRCTSGQLLVREGGAPSRKVPGILVTRRGVSASDMVTKMGVRPHGGP